MFKGDALELSSVRFRSFEIDPQSQIAGGGDAGAIGTKAGGRVARTSSDSMRQYRRDAGRLN